MESGIDKQTHSRLDTFLRTQEGATNSMQQKNMAIVEIRGRLSVGPFLSVLFCCLYISVAPHVDILPWFEAYNEKRLLELLLLIVLLGFSICNSSSRENWLSIFEYLPVRSKILLCFMATIGIVSSTQAASPRFALLEVSLFVLLFAAMICVASCRVHLVGLFDKMIAIALVMMGWLCLIGFLGYYLFALINGTPFSQHDLLGNFSNIRFFNQIQSWTLSLMVLPLLLFPKRSLFITILFIAVAIGWWLLVFISGGRGILISGLIAIPVTFLLFGKQAKCWFRWQVVAFTDGLVAYLLCFFLIPKIMSVDFGFFLGSTIGRNMTYTADRMQLWSSAVQMVQDMPWLGIGPMNYAIKSNNIATHPHNSLLQIAAEWGLPVALIVIVIFFWGLLEWIKISKSPPAMSDININVALFASLLTAAIYSLFCGVIVMPLSQVSLILVIGWMLGIAVRGEAGRKKKHSRLSHLLLCLFCSIAIFGVVWPIFPEVLCLEKLQAEYMKCHPAESHFKPRFWQQGDINRHLGTVECQK